MKVRTEVKIGIIFVITALFFFWGLNFLKGMNILKPSNSYYIIYNNTKGLMVTSPVTIKGFQVGRVSDIELTENNQLLVKLNLDKKIRLNLGSTAKLQDVDMLGTKGIEIILSDDYNNFHQMNDTLIGLTSNGFIAEIANEITPLKNKTEQLITNIDSIVQSIIEQRTINEISATITNLKNVSAELDKMLKQSVTPVFVDLKKISGTLADNQQNINTTLANISMISDSIQQSQIISNADSTLLHMNEILTKINTGNSSLSKLVNEDSLYVNLNQTLFDLDQLIKAVKDNPKKYIKISVF